MRLAYAFALCFLGAASARSATFSGVLVDAKCYEAEERNISPNDTQSYADRDLDMEARYCAPNLKTKTFAIVLYDWSHPRLDAVGNQKAAELVRKIGKKRNFPVVVKGEITKNTVQVNSISSP